MTSFLSPLSLPAVKSVSLVCFFIDSCFLPWCLQYEIGKWRNTKTHCKVHKNGLLNMICQFLFGRNNSSKNILVWTFSAPTIRPKPDQSFQQKSLYLLLEKAMLCRDGAESQYLSEFNFSLVDVVDVLSDETTEKLSAILL